MIQIQNVIVSLDVLTKEFSCDLSRCRGACCVEGDAGAPVSDKEVEQIEGMLDVIWDDLTPEAREIIGKQGVAYVDVQGELVTSIVDGKDCVFAYHDVKGCCYCSIEKAYRENRSVFLKPASCHLYPIRVKRIGEMWGLNYSRWNICQSAIEKGRKERTSLYRYLKEPLVTKFGEEWYNELELTVNEMRRQGII